MCATLNGNPYATIVPCFSPTNASNKIDITTSKNGLPLLDTFINITF